MCKIAFLTYVHNAEKSLKKTVESVIHQTYEDLVYYLVDNASTDGTWAIMCEYAKRDSRIRRIQNENSLVALPDYIKSIKDCEYFAVLDAGDEYEPEFATDTICFLEKEDLDVAAVGTQFNDPAGNVFQRDVEEEIMVVEHNKLNEHFIRLTLYFRAMWGKVFRLSLIQAMDFSKFDALAKKGVFYGPDTLFCTSALRGARRVGVLNKVLHQYQADVASDSRIYRPERFHAVMVTVEEWIELLGDVHQIDQDNFLQIARMYKGALTGQIDILIRSDMEAESFLKEIRTIAEFPITGLILELEPEIKRRIMLAMINRIRGVDHDPNIAGLFYECLIRLKAVEMFRSYL